jgi:5-methyltetrahydrofolate--homocysteine methyltransferase
MTKLIGTKSSVEFGPGLPLLLINDQLRVYDQNETVLEELQAGNTSHLVQLALDGVQHGCQAVDLLIDHHTLDEAELLPLVLKAVDEAVGCPVSIDSRNPSAIDRAMEGYTGKALLNSIVYEQEVLDDLLPLVVKHNMAVIAMLVDDVRIPETWQERLAVAHKILEVTDDAGIAREDVVFDCVCLAASAVPNSMQVTLETLKAVHEELGMSTLLGIGNAGFGMPDQTRLDMIYLAIGASWGLDAALVDFHTDHLLTYTKATDFLTGRDLYGANYISLYRKSDRQVSRRPRPKRKNN